MKFVHFLSKTLGFQQNFIAPEADSKKKSLHKLVITEKGYYIYIDSGIFFVEIDLEFFMTFEISYI